VTAPADVTAALEKGTSAGKESALLLVSRQGQHRFVAVPVAAS
jgi:hypothetical protein